MRGDGNCGWRGERLCLVPACHCQCSCANIPTALAFGYFEALVRSADPLAPMAEIARLTSLNNLLDSMGYQDDIYVDFVDETMQLLKRIASGALNHDREAALLSSFNDPDVCNGIIMHFRVSGWTSCAFGGGKLTHSSSLLEPG